MKMKPRGKNLNKTIISMEEDHRTDIQELIVFTLPLLLNCFYIENVLPFIEQKDIYQCFYSMASILTLFFSGTCFDIGMNLKLFHILILFWDGEMCISKQHSSCLFGCQNFSCWIQCFFSKVVAPSGEPAMLQMSLSLHISLCSLPGRL